jgi:tetratricopeptide (TPR) repeat protein
MKNNNNITTKYPIFILFILLFGQACSNQNREDANIFFLKANLNLVKGNYPEAIRLYDEALSKYPEFPDALHNKSIALFKQNKKEDALVAVEAALALDPKFSEARYSYAEYLFNLNKTREATEELIKLEKVYADSSKFHLLLGDLKTATTDGSAALQAYDRAIRLAPQFTEAYVNRGTHYFLTKQLEAAKADFEEALRLNPKQIEALNNLGLIEVEREHWDEALVFFEKALSIDPVYPYSLNNKGFVLLQKGELEKGRSFIEHSLRLLPNNGYALRNIGLYYLQIGDSSNAVSFFNKATSGNEKVENVYSYLAQAHQKGGNTKEACTNLKRAKLLNEPLATTLQVPGCK